MNAFATLLAASLLLGSVLPQGDASVGVQRHRSQPYNLIQQVRTDTWQVDHTLVDLYARDLHAAGVLAQTSPHHDAHGAVDGFTLLQVVEGSPLYQAGLRSGDVVHRVEDRPLGGPLRGLMILRDLRDAEAVDVQLTRSGESLELHYLVPR